MKGKIYRYELENGLQVALYEDPGSSVAEVRLYLRAGSIYEGKLLGSGVSHFLEHVTAEGPTNRRTKEEIDKEMIKLGNAFNAYTTKDHTCYHITTLSSYYKEATELISELVFENKISRKAFDREKGVISREIEKAQEEPSKLIHEMTSENVYLKHPARYPVLGYKDLFSALSYEDLQWYYNEKYSPDNAVLVIGGDIDAALVIENVERSLSKYKRRNGSADSLPEEPKMLGLREKKKLKKDMKGAYLNLTWLTIDLYDEDLYALDILSEILASGKLSRLKKYLKEEKQLVNSIDSYSYTPTYAKGEFTINSKFEGVDYRDVEKAILEVVRDLRENEVSDQELTRVKKLLKSEFLMENTSASSITSKIGLDVLTTGNEEFSKHYVEKMQEVSAQDIQNMAIKYLDPEIYSRVVLLPDAEQMEEELTNEEQLYEPKMLTLENGIRLITKKVPNIDVVNYAIFLKGGQSYDTVYNKAGIFNFLSTMLAKGTEKLSREELDNEFEKRGAGFSTSSGNNTFFLKAFSLAEDSKKIIGLLESIITSPAFPEAEIEKLRKFTLQNLKQEKNSWNREASLNFRQSMFPENSPYRYSKLGTMESVQSINIETLKKLYSDFIVPSNIVISVVGDIDEQEILKDVENTFGKIISSTDKIPAYVLEDLSLSETKSKRYLSSKKDMAVIHIGFPSVNMERSDVRVKFDIIDSIISGVSYPSGWLHERLRAKELVYVTHAYNMSYLKSGCFALMAATNPKTEAKCIKEMKSVINDLKAYKFTDTEIEEAKNQIRIMQTLSQETPSAQAEDYAVNEILGFGYDFEEKYLEKVDAVNRKDLQEIIKEYFNNYYLVVTSPEQ